MVPPLDRTTTDGRPQGSLSNLSLQMELWPDCNLRCGHCGRTTFTSSVPPLTLAQWRDVARDAQALGFRRVALRGQGEPLMHPQFREILGVLSLGGFSILLSTNGTLVTETLAACLYGHNVSVVVRRDSNTAAIQDAVIGVPGVAEPMERGLQALLNAGYPDRDHPLGVLSAVSAHNVKDVPEVARWARNQGIEAHVACPGPDVNQAPARQLSREELDALTKALATARGDSAPVRCWSRAVRVCITAQGDVSLHPHPTAILGSVRTERLSAILQRAQVTSPANCGTDGAGAFCTRCALNAMEGEA